MTGRRRRDYISQKTGKKVSRQATHFTKRYREMEYTAHMHAPVPLARGKYEGYAFVILNLGSHPTAYVCLPKDHPLFKVDVHSAGNELNVHGDITYAEKEVVTSTITDRWWLGWDYGHAGLGDYTPFITSGLGNSLGATKKWTREEILVEVKDVINQLKKLEK